MPGRFTHDDVERVAELARLALDAGEKDLFARQLAGILAYAEQIQGVDTDGVPDAQTASAAPDAGRADDVRPSLASDDVLAAAPEADREAALFKVPRVLG
jgi:aspartyl-tRNA(Asn)/glutamyl-tRNA(Gln) amidotransferase subunit C